VFRDADWDMFSDSDSQEALAFRGGIWEALTAGDHPVAAPTEIRAIEVRDHRDGVVVHVEARSYNGAARVERFFALENVCVTVGDADYCESGVVLHTTTGPDASTTVASTNGRSGGENPNSNPSSDDGSSLPSLSVIVPLCVMVAFFLVVIIAIVIRKKREYNHARDIESMYKRSPSAFSLDERSSTLRDMLDNFSNDGQGTLGAGVAAKDSVRGSEATGANSMRRHSALDELFEDDPLSSGLNETALASNQRADLYASAADDDDADVYELASHDQVENDEVLARQARLSLVNKRRSSASLGLYTRQAPGFEDGPAYDMADAPSYDVADTTNSSSSGPRSHASQEQASSEA